MDAIQEFEQYCALHPDPWLQAIQAIQNQPLQSFVPLPALQATQATQQSTPPAPQEAQKEVEQVKKMALYQATVEDDTEINAEKHDLQPLHQATVEDMEDDMPDSKSTLSSMPRLCATRSSGDSAACLSNALLASFLTSFFALASFLAWHGLLPGYIECIEGMEATGQG